MFLGIIGIDRPLISRPGPVFGQLLEANIPLPTNSWLESLFLGKTNHGPFNRVFQVPYIIDTNGYIQGTRAHSVHVQGLIRQVEMTFETPNGLTIGAAEEFSSQFTLFHDNTEPHGVARLSAVLEWSRSPSIEHPYEMVPKMRAPIVRGSPYMTMEYFDASPRIYIQRHLSLNTDPVNEDGMVLKCGTRPGEWSGTPLLVKNDLTMTFDSADTTWMLFVSEPMVLLNTLPPHESFTSLTILC